MSKQRSTLSKVRNFNAKLVRHCCFFGNKVERCFDIVAKNGNNVEATFDIVAFDNVASTLLLVWTGLNGTVMVFAENTSFHFCLKVFRADDYMTFRWGYEATWVGNDGCFL